VTSLERKSNGKNERKNEFLQSRGISREYKGYFQCDRRNLISGRRRKDAVLIDTCLGVGHLRDFIKTLTQKPVTVLLTHGHVDHALGAPEFERVFMKEQDCKLFQEHSPIEERKGYLQATLGERFNQLDESAYVLPELDKEFLELREGMSFDLGGTHIDVYELPGHTQGSMIFLIREQKILILGDACNNSTFLFDQHSSSVEAYREELIRVREQVAGKFERVFLSHHVMETDTDILDNMIAVCDEILNGKADDIPFEFMGMQAYIAKKCNERFERADGKSGNLIYNKQHIRN